MCSQTNSQLKFTQLRGPSVGYIGTLFILAKDSKSLKDLKKNKKNWGILCKVVLQGGPFEIGPS